MPRHIVKVLVPPPVALPRGACRAADIAAWILRVLQLAPWSRRSNAKRRMRSQRLRRQNERRTAQDLLALARSVEREMPDLAAELRIAAMHRPDASG